MRFATPRLPSPTVAASLTYNAVSNKQGLELVEARAIHDTRGNRGGAIDVTDRPCSTIGYGV